MEQLLAVLPFGGTLDLVQLKGSTLRKVFEFSVRRYGQGSGEFLQVSGLLLVRSSVLALMFRRSQSLPPGFHVELDVSKPAGSRVRSLRILCTKCRVPRYEPVADAAVYTVVVPEYLVSGGDGYTVIRDEMVKHSSGEALGGGFWLVPERRSFIPHLLRL